MKPVNTITAFFLALVCSLLAFNSHAVERVTYYHLDALGSPTAATDQNGAVRWREHYRPFGERIDYENEDGTNPNRGPKNTAWYTGKLEHEDIGLSYYGARWYDAKLGRFTGIDPVGFKEGNIHSFNRYAYANNNPYLYIDPDGREPDIRTWHLIYSSGMNTQAQHKVEQKVIDFLTGPERMCQQFNCATGTPPDLGIRGGAKSLIAKEGAAASQAAKGAMSYKLKPQDMDWRGTGKSHKDALVAAFEKTGLKRSEFEVTKWGRDANGKSFPAEYRHNSGAEVNIDWGHSKNGPDAPHVGWQTGGKRSSGGAIRGHIILDNVPYNR